MYAREKKQRFLLIPVNITQKDEQKPFVEAFKKIANILSKLSNEATKRI